jgi:hypothetical protein
VWEATHNGRVVGEANFFRWVGFGSSKEVGMSLYQVQQCLFDYLRVLEDPKTEGRPEIDTEGYDLSDTERKALESKDIGEIYVMGVHPVIVNGYCRALGYKRADYRPMLEAAAVKTEPRKVRWQK